MILMPSKRFRIAFSFAGEKREYVAQVAALLADRFGEDKILYDKSHEAEFAIFNLGIRLPKLYREESDLIVVVLSPDYDHKQWTGWEWTAIYSHLTKNAGDNVMLTRFAFAKVDGLFDAAAFVELDHKTPEQVAALILERLAINENLPKDYYTKPAAGSSARRAAIPNNLPRLQYFFGREAELKKIAEALTEDARGWGALIDGPGGIGKTSLAIRAAEMVPAGRFQRIIFLSSKESELTADGERSLGTFALPSYLEMLNAIARELGKTEITKITEVERPEALLRALRDENVLLLLDNLETLSESDRDQLFAILNRLPRGCSAIVTSRRRADASTVTIRLDKLDWPAAQELIAELAKHNDRLKKANTAEYRMLYDETGGNPLLIRWIAAQLERGSRTIKSALAMLLGAPARNDPLEFIFGNLLTHFTANEVSLLAALSFFTTPIEDQFIAEVAGVSEAAAQVALSELTGRALVLSDKEDRRFLLMPKIADFLRRTIPEVVAETGRRLEARAYSLIESNGYNKYDRFLVLETEWPTVAPAIPLFVAGDNQRLQTVCDALWRFFEFSGRQDEGLSLYQQAETKAVAINDYSNAGWRAFQAGWFYFQRQQADDLLAAAERTAKHWQNADVDADQQAIAIRLRGLGYELKKDYPNAAAAYREALALWRSKSAESQDVVIALNALARAEQLSGDYSASERDYREALRIARAVGNAEMIAGILGRLAELALDQKDWLQAETLAREALALSEKVGRMELIASNYQRIAKALARQGEAAEGLPYAQRAVEIYERLGSPDLENARTTLRECES